MKNLIFTHCELAELAGPVLRIGGQLVRRLVAALKAPILARSYLPAVPYHDLRRGIALVIAVLFHFSYNTQTA